MFQNMIVVPKEFQDKLAKMYERENMPLATKEYKWETIQKAVTDLNRLEIAKIGKSFGKERLYQESVRPHEIVQQILSMAPGDHPHLGPILLDLAEKLKESDNEWR